MKAQKIEEFHITFGEDLPDGATHYESIEDTWYIKRRGKWIVMRKDFPKPMTDYEFLCYLGYIDIIHDILSLKNNDSYKDEGSNDWYVKKNGKWHIEGDNS